jgi:DNA-binding PadR family transcriptional regulator
MRSIFRETFLGFVRVHLLHHAAHERIYGAAMIQELRRHGYDLSAGTLYPILHAMHDAGYLASKQANESGKVRRYYVATAKGRAALDKLKARIRELTDELLEEDDPARPGRSPRPRRVARPPRRS